MRLILFIFTFLYCFGCQTDTQVMKIVDEVEVVRLETIVLETCEFSISEEQLTAKKELFIIFPEVCDSNIIKVPVGGTVTNARLYIDSTLTEPIAGTSSFYILDKEGGAIALSNNIKGRFFLCYGSCHWSTEMWINIAN